jgi:hypothetical protein
MLFFCMRYTIILLFIFLYKIHHRRHLGGAPTALFMHTSWQYVLKYCCDRAPFFNFSHRLANRTKFDRKKKYPIDEVICAYLGPSPRLFLYTWHTSSRRPCLGNGKSENPLRTWRLFVLFVGEKKTMKVKRLIKIN